MNNNNFRIEEYSDTYKEQIKDVIGKTLADISVINRKNLPLNDPDLDEIEKVYFGKGRFWVAIKNDEVIGTVAIRDLGNNSAKLNRMFVLIKHHGDGTGQKLLDHALLFAKKQGFTKIILNTHELMHRAHRFYEKNGFKRVGKTGDKYNYEKILI